MVTTLAEILPHAARIHADRIALIVDDWQFTFRELDAMSNRVASGLVAIGINQGDRVSLFGPNSWEWLGAEVSRADLVSHCREHLAAYKVPRALQFVASVPTTSSGKIIGGC